MRMSRSVLPLLLVSILFFIAGWASPTTNLQGRPVSSTTPLTGNVLTFDGTQWGPGAGTPANHHASHEDGGADEISVASLSGLLADGQKVAVAEEGSIVGTRPTLNFIGGSVTAVDNAGANRLDLSFTASGSVDGTGVANRLAIWSDADSLTNSADLSFASGVLTLGGASATRDVQVGGTMVSGAPAKAMTVTMPASAASETVADYVITSAGSGVVGKRGLSVTMDPGYTSAGLVVPLAGYNGVAGTGAALNLATGAESLTNKGVIGVASASTAGTNLGVEGFANGGALGIGVVGKGKGSTSSIGVLGAGMTGATNTIGVYAAYIPVDVPSFAGLNAALVANNGTASVASIVAQDNGVTKWQIADSGYMQHTVGTLTASGDKAVQVTATMPAASSSEGVLSWVVTSGGSGVVGKRGASFDLLPGYTDAGISAALEANNTVAGTGNSLRLATAGGEAFGNTGFAGFAAGVTAGTNVGAHGEASGATGRNVGGLFKAISGAAAQNIGAVGAASGGTVNVGVYAGLTPGADLTLTSAALVADNNAVAATIFDARENGSSAFRVLDGGNQDWHKHQSLNAVMENRTTDIGTPVAGNYYFKTDVPGLRIFNGSTWDTYSPAAGGGTIDGSGAASRIAFWSDADTLTSDAQFTYASDVLTLGDGGTTKTRMVHDAGTLGADQYARAVTATLPNATGHQSGEQLDFTTTGSTGNRHGINLQLEAGFTGSGDTSGLLAENHVAGAGNGLNIAQVDGNFGVEASSYGNGSGLNVGVTGLSGNSSGRNVGVVGFAAAESGSASLVGVIGAAAGSTGTNIGGFFSRAAAGITLPSQSAALIADAEDSGSPSTVDAGGGTLGRLVFVVKRTTTNSAAATEVTLDSGNTLFLPALANGDTWMLQGYITARGTAGTNDDKSATYDFWALISRTGSTTTLVNSAVNVRGEEIAGWDVTLAADDANERLTVSVTGDAATTIKWAGWVEGTRIQ